jgi:hypothetical protein
VKLTYTLLTLATALALCGCPPGTQPARDGGRRCSNVAECNSNNATCGVVFDCVLGYCANSTMVRACPDGAYPPSDSSSGECLQSEDCNPPNACGPIIACINYNCDRNGPRINIPCFDSGMTVRDSGITSDAQTASDASEQSDSTARDATAE